MTPSRAVKKKTYFPRKCQTQIIQCKDTKSVYFSINK